MVFSEDVGGSCGNGRELLLDTQGACFLCLQDPSSGDEKYCSENGGIGLEGVNLRDVCRYLEIRGLGKSSLEGGGGGSTEFVVDLCGKCGVHVNQLSEQIRVLEETERGIARRLQDIQVVMKRCLEREECKLQWKKIRENNPIEFRLIESLREETGQKGYEKLKILTAAKTTPPTVLNDSSVETPSNLNSSGVEPEAEAPSSCSNQTPMSATSLTAPPPTSASTNGVPRSSSGDTNRNPDSAIDILSNGSSGSKKATRTSQLDRSSVNASFTLSASGRETETAAASSTPNPTSMLATPLTAQLSTSASACEVPLTPSIEILSNGSCPETETATRTTPIFKGPSTQLLGSSTPASSNLNKIDEVNSSGNEMGPDAVVTSTVPNRKSKTMPSSRPPVAASTNEVTMAASSDEDSSNETPPLASTPKKWPSYRGDPTTIFSRSYGSQVKNGVQQFNCHHCKTIVKNVKKDSSKIRIHILSEHPEALFTNVASSSHLEFKKCVKTLLLSQLKQVILKDGKASSQCKLCQVSFRHERDCKYHLVMKHYSTLEQKLRRLQEGVGSGTDEAEKSATIERREELGLSERRVGRHRVSAGPPASTSDVSMPPSSASPETATRATPISKAPPTRLTDSQTRASSNFNKNDGVNPSSSTNPDSSMETPFKASSSIKRRNYTGPANKIFSKNYKSQLKDGVQRFQCLICKKYPSGNSSKIRRHILSKHPEALFTNVSRSSPLEFKYYVRELLSKELGNMILKNGKSSYQCELCKVIFRRECKYHLVMKHYSILEKKLNRLQAGESVAVRGREGFGLSEGRVGMDKVAGTRARFECLIWDGGCGRIFSKVENLRMHEKVCKGRKVNRTLEGNERKMQNLNERGNLSQGTALVKSKANVGVSGGHQSGTRRDARQEKSVGTIEMIKLDD